MTDLTFLLLLSASAAVFFLIPFRVLRRKGSVARYGASSLFALALWGLFWCIPLCWDLRDGLGPDAVLSSGPEAVARFLELLWHLALIPIVPLLAALVLSRFALDGSDTSAVR